MPRTPENQRHRVRVQVSIDPTIWERCQQTKAALAGFISWSQVAEHAFMTVLDQVEAMQVEVFSRLRPDATDDEKHAAMVAFLSRKNHAMMSEAYAQLDEDLKTPPKPVKAGPRAS